MSIFNVKNSKEVVKYLVSEAQNAFLKNARRVLEIINSSLSTPRLASRTVSENSFIHIVTWAVLDTFL